MALNLRLGKSRRVWSLVVIAGAVLVLFATKRANETSPSRILADSIAGCFDGLVPSQGSARRPGTIVRHVLTVDELSRPQAAHFALRLRHQAELEDRVRRGDVLSREELRARYLPTDESWSAVAAWAASQGLEVQPADGSRLTVFASGTVRQIQTALKMEFARVIGTDGTEHTSAISAPAVPASIADMLTGVLQLQPHLRPVPASNGSPAIAQGTKTIPADVQRLYRTGETGLDGAGQTIVVVGIAVVDPHDLELFWEATGSAASLDNFMQIPGGIYGWPADEETMDIEWAAAMAPRARIVYFPKTDPELCTAWILDQPDSANIHQVTSSYGVPEFQSVYVTSQYYLALAAVGVTFFNSTGDYGSATSFAQFSPKFSYDPLATPNPSYPSTDPFVTAVGGTTVQFAGEGPARTIEREGAWTLRNDLSPTEQAGGNASTGGHSLRHARPAWQTGTQMPPGRHRQVPDVAAIASASELPLVVYQGIAQSMGGTSLSAPIWAGLAALVNQARADTALPPLGLLGPKIYPLMGSPAFRPITTGSCSANDGFAKTASNGAYIVAPGFNLITGLGPPDMPQLVAALTQPGTPPLIEVQPESQLVPQGGTATFSVQVAGGGPTSFDWIVGSVVVEDGPLRTANPHLSPIPEFCGTAAGAHTSTLTITNPTTSGDVPVQVVISNALGSVCSDKVSLMTTDTVFQWYPSSSAAPYGEPLGSAYFNASASVPGTIGYSHPVDTIFDVGSHELTATFVPSDPVAHRTVALTRRVTVKKGIPEICWNAPASVAFGVPLGDQHLNASSAIEGTFTYSPLRGVVLSTGVHTLEVSFQPADSAHYDAVVLQRQVIVSPPGLDQWSVTTIEGDASVSTASGRQDFITTGPAGGTVVWSLGSPLPVTQSWSAETGVHLAAGALLESQEIKLSMAILPTADLAAGSNSSRRAGISWVNRGPLTSRECDFSVRAGTESFTFPSRSNYATDLRLRFAYSAEMRELVASVQTADLQWHRFGVVRLGAGDFNWNLGNDESFSIQLCASARSLEGRAAPELEAGSAYFTSFLAPRWAPHFRAIPRVADNLAQFIEPSGIAVDSDGALYIADGENRIIRRLSPEGQVTTLAGNPRALGNTNGVGDEATFQRLAGITMGPDRTIIVADQLNMQLRRVTPDGVVSAIAGSGMVSGFVDGTELEAQFDGPMAVAVGARDEIYVADAGNNAIRKVSFEGVVTTYAGDGFAGTGDGPRATARFSGPTGVAVDSQGNVYVADTGNHLIRRISSDGVVTTLAGTGAAGFSDGSGRQASFRLPMGLALDKDDNLYVADSGNHAIRRITPAGDVRTLAGNGSPSMQDGLGTAAGLNEPRALALDAQGNVIVADALNHAVRKIDSTGVVTTLAGGNGAGYANGPARYQYARVAAPSAIAFAPDGSYLVANRANHTLSRVSADDRLIGVIGDGELGLRDGSAGLARFHQTAALTFDPDGIAYAVDAGSHTLRRIALDGTVQTVAGNGESGFADGAGAAVRLNSPMGLADRYDGIVIADRDNHCLRRWDHDGNVTTLAGSAIPSSADGAAEFAGFDHPSGIACTRHDVLYVADTGNHLIRQVAASGAVSTFTGATPGEGGEILPLSSPTYLVADVGSNAFFYESDTRYLSFLNSQGVVTRLKAFDADITGMAIDQSGTLHVLSALRNAVDQLGFQTDPQIVWVPPTTLVYGDSLESVRNAQADVPGTFSYKLPRADRPDRDTYSIQVTFTPLNQLEYSSATVKRDLVIGQAPQSIDFTLPATATFPGTILLPGNSRAGLPIVFEISGPGHLDPSGRLVLDGVGAVTVRARQPGSWNYLPADDVVQTTFVTQAPLLEQTILPSALSSTLGFQADPIALDDYFMVSSGLPLEFQLVTGPGRLTGSTLTLTGAGNIVVRAAQPGNESYQPALPTDRTLIVTPNIDSWKRDHFGENEWCDALISGNDADPDGDGLSNFLEYALGLDPRRPNTPHSGTVKWRGGEWVFTYSRPAERPELVYEVEYSEDLTSWSTQGLVSECVDEGVMEVWEARHPESSGAAAFFRLAVRLR